MASLVVDNSILSTVAKCSTRATLEYVLHRRPKGEGAELRVGSDIHEALARWVVTGGDVGKAMARFKKRYEPWAEDNVGPSHKEFERLSYAPVARILRAWLESHPLDRWSWVILPEHVELAWQAPLMEVDGTEVVFVALLDGLAKRRTGGGLFSLDHKTTRGLTDYWKDRQEDGSQFSGQLWLAPQNTDKVITGIVVNGIELPKLNSSPRRCSKHGVSYKECALQHLRSDVVVVTRSRGEIATWEKTAKILTRKFIRLRERVAKFEDIATVPMEGRFNGSCGFCGARPWCRIGRPTHAPADFFEEAEPWEPLKMAGKRGGAKS